MPNNPPSTRNPHPLPVPNDWDQQQTKNSHHHREPCPKDNQVARVGNPLADEKGPGEGNQPAQDADHYETVWGEGGVGVDELFFR